MLFMIIVISILYVISLFKNFLIDHSEQKRKNETA